MRGPFKSFSISCHFMLKICSLLVGWLRFIIYQENIDIVRSAKLLFTTLGGSVAVRLLTLG